LNHKKFPLTEQQEALTILWCQPINGQMRIHVAILLVLVFAAFAACADETLPVLRVGNDYYTNVTVTSVTPTDIYFTHDKGMGNAKLKKLDPRLQSHFTSGTPLQAAAVDGQSSGDVQSSEPVADTGGGPSASAKLWPTIVAKATPIIAYARGYTMQHKPVVFGGVAGVVVLLLFIRSKTKKPRQVI
jgi:hypothetical protein